jgi:predicted transcriptional regulator
MTAESHGTLATAGHIRRNPVLTAREQLHQLLDSLPDAELKAAKRALEKIAHRPTLAEFFANAPYSDEVLTDEERAAIAEGVADVVAGRVISDEELGRRRGLPPP